ncbi:MAG: NADH:flavin oxidoreductase/NADH oxidase family protein [Corynebacterium sp.]|uniref:NADH:flavin oxidoreductase/NADH oxidase family protein n=1 Tax=Corynebacterium sp. TaxID=1720 RepID=UPI0026DC6F4C|nr:NADH:flavin oxidoreductase/NADH oxidase family protein [Corynebacterium sp.]MDO5099661.1 NADH:flavin oxidoreductase/NADH oxidase family protein [Corynebacterium sp.]
MTPRHIAEPITLPSGAVVKNRFFKSAMHEALGTTAGAPDPKIAQLYRTWAEGGAGVLVTGNMMVDRNHPGEPGNVFIEDERDLAVLKEWAAAGTVNGTHLWMQINHPGKQSPKSVNTAPVAPSAIPLSSDADAFFATPRALTITEIHQVQQKFVTTAVIAQKAGFTGVQIHAAHGYLVSQFLSPEHNQRTDEYGGSLENRQRFLVEIYQSMREALGADFPISVKMNSTDGTKDGFSTEDSLDTAKRLSELGVDVIEISGGTYTSPIMMETGQYSGGRSKATFSDYAVKLRSVVSTPVAATGGFRDAAGMEQALADGVTDFIGIARPLALYPDLPNQILSGNTQTYLLPRLSTGIKTIDDRLGSLLGIVGYELQMHKIAEGKKPQITRFTAKQALLHALWHHGKAALATRRA